MSSAPGLKIGKLIYLYLKANQNILNMNGMSASQIQPAPLKEKAKVDVAVVYEINAVNPILVKQHKTIREMPNVYEVAVTVECVHKSYNKSIELAEYVTVALCTQPYNNNLSVKNNGFNLSGMQETYDKKRRLYSKLLTFDARILL